MKRKYPEYSRTRRDHTPSNDGYFYDERPHPVSRQEQERQRRRRATRRRRQQRRLLTWAAVCIVIAAVCIALFRFWPGGVFSSSPEDPASQGANGAGQLTNGNNLDHVDITPKSGDSETVLALKELAQEYPQVKKILDKIDSYSEDLIALALKNSEAIDYVVDYPSKKDKHPAIDLSSEAAQNTVPLLLQWDERWGYQEYGSGLIGWTGCGPTCMSMLALYLTGNETWNPASVAHWAEENGYYAEGSGTSWTFMSEGSAHFGLRAEELPLVKQYMINAVEEGRPVVCAMAPGDFTTTGHYIILTGYDENGFTVNDPNSPMRSSQHWTYETLEGQISNLWAFSKA